MVRRDEKLAICTLIANYDSTGGLQNQAKLLINELTAKGTTVFVLTRNQEKLKRNEKRGNIFISRFPTIGSLRVVNSIIYIFCSLCWLLLNHKKYQIIHCHQSYSPATIGVLVKLVLKKPVVVKISGSNEYGEVTEIKKLPFQKVRIFLLKKVDRFIILNEGMRKELNSIHILDENINLIPNGVKIPEESSFDNNVKRHYRKKLKLPYENIIAYSGRLTEGKGLEMLIEVWSEVIKANSGVHLILLGEGGRFRSIEEKLKDRTKSLDLSDIIHFFGYVPNVNEYLMASDIFILPSISEGMSNALLEAMASGVSIISTKIPANISLITNGVNGILVERENISQLKDAVITLLNNPSLRETFGREAKKTVSNLCSIEYVAKRYREIYSGLIFPSVVLNAD